MRPRRPQSARAPPLCADRSSQHGRRCASASRATRAPARRPSRVPQAGEGTARGRSCTGGTHLNANRKPATAWRGRKVAPDARYRCSRADGRPERRGVGGTGAWVGGARRLQGRRVGDDDDTAAGGPAARSARRSQLDRARQLVEHDSPIGMAERNANAAPHAASQRHPRARGGCVGPTTTRASTATRSTTRGGRSCGKRLTFRASARDRRPEAGALAGCMDERRAAR